MVYWRPQIGSPSSDRTTTRAQFFGQREHTMTKRDIAHLACKILAIVALLDFVGTLQSLVTNVQR